MINKSQFVLFALLSFAFISPARATILYVKANATGANNGKSWTNAYNDLQSALAAAKSGDEIWVAAGTYKPTRDTDKSKSFVLLPGVGLYGGFAGTEIARNQRDWTKRISILSGDIGALGNDTDNSAHVVVGASNAVLDGFTVTGGHDRGGGMYNENVSPTVANCIFSANSAPNRLDGAGMYNYGQNARPQVMNCTFTGNTAVGNGGGMYNEMCSPIVTNCTFHGNRANGYASGGGGRGGGMCNFSYPSLITAPQVTNCTFSNNVGGFGGGMGNNFSAPIVTGCRFIGNTGLQGYLQGRGGGMNNKQSPANVTRCVFVGNMASYGAGVCNTASSATLTNCLITSNTAGVIGGGIFSEDVSSGFKTNVIHCTFFANRSIQYGGAMSYDGVTQTVKNCIFWNNLAPTGAEILKFDSGLTGVSIFQHCDIRGGKNGTAWNAALGTDGGGNIAADPLFVNASNPAGPDALWGTADDGLVLRKNSPCINAGLGTGAPATDLPGHPRIGLPDIGAFEYAAPNAVAVWKIYH